jgi:hypothetical protein
MRHEARDHIKRVADSRSLLSRRTTRLANPHCDAPEAADYSGGQITFAKKAAMRASRFGSVPARESSGLPNGPSQRPRRWQLASASNRAYRGPASAAAR